ncbi:hypothetical protein GCM10010912_16760 [Paenibacillus albidus]|uniref:Uncharacterized protein n=1 Tax=Paenibacillus albidus TaxID=2041023 RepID=A0A917C5U9_9BACL|nr:hypothetical protein [Paenibacillus albidus]GGF72290.1 hypothetical protein GCM10010912_16760 [Paenibacillus albidus]
MNIHPENQPLPDVHMSEKDKLEFAEALAFRYVQLTFQANSADPLASTEQIRNQASEELRRLSNLLPDLPEDIQGLVKDRIRLYQK